MQFFYDSGNITYDVFEISAKAPCGAALMGARHECIETSDFVMRTFVPPCELPIV